ncbi:slipin family protein [Urbifossiella limnaea]|uniref:FtsH protease regulator HflK n=1 Tax=Urbifossiella limnaea TaxID=2528023 RepID=A0A517XQ07_9BACT|nr:slipin family protein [Urbifossiella limnaea]QDU19582.1 FtsH protease regulator HflK [Urbifossiella limnaea]
MTATKDIIIRDTHRGLKYVDGVLAEVLPPGRHELPRRRLFRRTPKVDVTVVDLRNRDLTIKGQEILTADKVAIRVSILVQFAVVDPKAAVQAVASYEDRLYTDVQLAARRSLAAMTLEDILTNRTRLSDDILREVQGAAAGYGVAIGRADVKDLVFPGNLQDIMNKVLAAERTSEAQLVEARTRAEVQRIDAQTKADAGRIQATADAEAVRTRAEADAAATRTRVEAERAALEERSKAAAAFTTHPALLRLEELTALKELGKNANARIYLDFAEAKNGEE